MSNALKILRFDTVQSANGYNSNALQAELIFQYSTEEMRTIQFSSSVLFFQLGSWR